MSNQRDTLPLTREFPFLCPKCAKRVGFPIGMTTEGREREWLEYAGLLHDIGNHISYEKHHRHSYYLIKHGDLRGFEPDEIAIMALLTRYHRRAVPRKDHDGVGELDKSQRRIVTILSAFLRLAETLDRSRHGVIRGIEVRERLGVASRS